VFGQCVRRSLLSQPPDKRCSLSGTWGPKQDDLSIQGQAKDFPLKLVQDGPIAERNPIDHSAPSAPPSGLCVGHLF
jgi:hypothetical protein